MTPFAGFSAGFGLGLAAGLWMGRDLAVSAARLLAGQAKGSFAFGLVRRMAVMILGLASGLGLGHGAFPGSAAGIVVGFIGYVVVRAKF